MTFVPPPGHPCAGHGCDGCATCLAGGCCCQQSARSAQRALAELEDIIFRAVVQDASHLTNRVLLVQLDSQHLAAAHDMPIVLERGNDNEEREELKAATLSLPSGRPFNIPTATPSQTSIYRSSHT